MENRRRTVVYQRTASTRCQFVFHRHLFIQETFETVTLQKLFLWSGSWDKFFRIYRVKSGHGSVFNTCLNTSAKQTARVGSSCTGKSKFGFGWLFQVHPVRTSQSPPGGFSYDPMIECHIIIGASESLWLCHNYYSSSCDCFGFLTSFKCNRSSIRSSDHVTFKYRVWYRAPLQSCWRPVAQCVLHTMCIRRCSYSC